MPLYEYRCDKCSLTFEELVSSSSASVNCPRCKAHDVTRQLSVFAAHGASSSAGGGCGGDDCACEAKPLGPKSGCCGGGGCCH